MSNWVKKIDLKDVWNKTEDGELSILALTKILVERLSVIHYSKKDSGSFEQLNQDLEEITGWFEDLIEDENNDADEFDSILNELYDFGDRTISNNKPFHDADKALWINK